MSPFYEVTVLVQNEDILGHPVPAEGALELRRYVALSEDHAREVASLGLTENEEIVSVAAEQESD